MLKCFYDLVIDQMCIYSCVYMLMCLYAQVFIWSSGYMLMYSYGQVFKCPCVQIVMCLPVVTKLCRVFLWQLKIN